VRISFRFNLDKAVQVLAFLLSELGRTDKAKLMKLVYLADREHFLRHGYPITGDRPCALKHGPVPSATFDAINGELCAPDNDVFRYLHAEDYHVELRQSPGVSLLSDDEQATLKDVLKQHGHKKTWDLVAETHQLPEYVESYVEGTSTPIPYERIAKFSGDPARFRLNRPVVSAATAARMIPPFGPDDDL